MNICQINKANVGRIAERIVANELECRGFLVSSINKEGCAVNIDLLATSALQTFQIQVKGATDTDGAWVNYGFASQDVIDRSKKMFNSAVGHYTANIVVLAAVKSPTEYKCLVLPIRLAEEAAQKNIDHAFRKLNLDGSKKKPGKAWVSIGYIPKPRDISRLPLMEAEQALIMPFLNNWDLESQVGSHL